MDYAWLLDFLALVDTRSFTEAARVRNSSQPAFSRRIQALEYWAGQRLIDRATQPVGLTPAGREFLPFARDMAERAQEVRAKLSAG